MWRKLAALFGTGVLLLTVGAAGLAHAQEPGEQAAPLGGVRAGGQFAGGQRVFGTVVSVSGANVTVKSIENGQTVTVVTTTNTRLMHGAGEPLQLASLKPGDGVTAMGQLDAPNKTLHAAMLFGMTPDQTRQMEQAAVEMKANLGKTYILGKVTAVDLDNLKMTVERPDGQAQTIGFDEGTSFKRGGRVTGLNGLGMGGYGGGRRGGNRPNSDAPAQPAQPAQGGNTPAITGGESITLADVKVGDNIGGLGALKSGTFVPHALNVQVRGEGRRRGSPEGGGAAPAQPGPGL